MEDKFLSCGNCVRWGLPWRLQHKFVLCHERNDENGRPYHVDHPACRYFVAASNVPQDLQTLRLLVQALSPTQLSYLAYAVKQAQSLLDTNDQDGSPLSLGDVVFFEKDERKHWGTVDGIAPSTSTHDRFPANRKLCLWSPSFPKESVIIKASETRRASRAELASFIDEQLQQDDRWEVTPDYLKEISRLRSQKQLSEEQRQELLKYEEQYALLHSEDKYLAALLAFRRNLK